MPYIKFTILMVIIGCTSVLAVCKYWYLLVHITTPKSLFALELFSLHLSVLELFCKFVNDSLVFWCNHEILPILNQDFGEGNFSLWHRFCRIGFIHRRIEAFAEGHAFRDAINRIVWNGLKCGICCYVIWYYNHIIVPVHMLRLGLGSLSRMLAGFFTLINIHKVQGKSLTNIFRLITQYRNYILPGRRCVVCASQ
eukprot:UN07802